MFQFDAKCAAVDNTLPIRPGELSYVEGIRYAYRTGSIVARSPDGILGPKDPWSHLQKSLSFGSQGIDATNSVPPSSLALEAFRFVSQHASDRLLELGPGLGVACSMFSRKVPGCSIDTVSLTPINPYLRFVTDRLPTGHSPAMDLEDMLKLQENGAAFFVERLDAPYVRRQYIGHYPGEAKPPPGFYDFIHESRGPIHHAGHINERGEFDWPSESMRDERTRIAILETMELLSPSGMLFSDSTGSVLRELGKLRASEHSANGIRTVACRDPRQSPEQDPLFVLLLKPQCPLLEVVEQLDTASGSEIADYYFDDSRVLEEHLLHASAQRPSLDDFSSPGGL